MDSAEGFSWAARHLSKGERCPVGAVIFRPLHCWKRCLPPLGLQLFERFLLPGSHCCKGKSALSSNHSCGRDGLNSDFWLAGFGSIPPAMTPILRLKFKVLWTIIWKNLTDFGNHWWKEVVCLVVALSKKVAQQTNEHVQLLNTNCSVSLPACEFVSNCRCFLWKADCLGQGSDLSQGIWVLSGRDWVRTSDKSS